MSIEQIDFYEGMGDISCPNCMTPAWTYISNSQVILSTLKYPQLAALWEDMQGLSDWHKMHTMKSMMVPA